MPPPRDSSSSMISMLEKAHGADLKDGSDGATFGGTGPHVLDSHTSFNKYATHEPGYENKLTTSLFMTMVGFSLSFVIAEVVPLFLITLFTVISYDVGDPNKSIWLIVSQFIAVASIVPFVGPLVDLIGRKMITLISLGLVAVSMVIFGTSISIGGMIVAMIVSGIGIGILLLTSIASVTELVPTHKRGLTIGYIVMGFLPFAPAPLYGQLLAEHSWRYVGLVIGLMAAVAFVILGVFYQPPPRPNGAGLTKRQYLKRIDWAGGALGITGITLFLVGLNWGGQDHPWRSVHVIAALTIGIAILIAFALYERLLAKHPMFPSRLAKQKRLFAAICLLCLTSGINYVPVVVFWAVQVYTVYGASFREAGIYLLPIGFCIAGGAFIGAIAMTVFSKHIQWVLLFFCVVQTAGLGSMAAIDPDDINTAWAPLCIGLMGVGGVLLPSQVVFSIISPQDLIGTSVALSIVVRGIGQVVGASLFYNLFTQRLQHLATTDLSLFAVPAIQAGLGIPPGSNIIIELTKLAAALSAGPFSAYAHYFTGITTPAQIAAIQLAGHDLYKDVFPIIYKISIGWGGAAIIACFFLSGISEFINDEVAVVL